MRALPAIALLLAALAVAASAAARNPKDPQQRHTAADMKLARTLALRQTDLAVGWRPAPPDPNPPSCTAGPDESNLVQTARIDPTFIARNGVTTIGSEVDIFKTAAMAETDWGFSTLALFRTCLLRSARDQLKHYIVRVVSAKRLPKPAATAERALHYRLVFSISDGASVVPLVSDMLAIGRGRETVVLHSFSVHTALPSSAMNELLRRLANRLGTGGI